MGEGELGSRSGRLARELDSGRKRGRTGGAAPDLEPGGNCGSLSDRNCVYIISLDISPKKI